MNTTIKNMSIAEASRIFKAMQGDKEAQRVTTLLEVELIPAETFAEFLLINRIRTYEEVIR